VFPLHKFLQDSKVNGWHNDYLQVFIESGILGFLAMIWLFASIYWQLIIYLKRRSGDAEERKYIFAITGGITAILISSLTGKAFLNILINMMFEFLLAMFALLLRNEKQTEMDSTQGRRKST
jgi:O-antigen ligase